MSQEAATGTPEIPACRQNPDLRVCVGPPETLPHDIPLPPAIDDVLVRLHTLGHRDQNIAYNPNECPLCEATATHINTCPTCRATLTQCLRSRRCGAASHPFAVLAATVAKKVVRDLTWPPHTFDLEEILELATATGMDLILHDDNYAPETAIKDTGKLTSYLYQPMNWALSDFRKHNFAPDKAIPLEYDDDDGREDNHLADHTPSTEDMSGVHAREQFELTGKIVRQYFETLTTEAERFVFRRWYTTRVDPTSADGRPSEEQIAAELYATTGTSRSQETISRWMTRFIRELTPRVEDPDNGLTPEYRARALNLIHGVYATPRTPFARTSDGDAPPAMATAPTDTLEGHHD